MGLVEEACEKCPEPLPMIYNFVQRFRAEVAEETIRARVYEAVGDGRVVRIARGVYFARSGPAQLLMVEGSAWDVLSKLGDDCVDALVTDPPGKFGRQWAGQGTTRPHSKLGRRTYAQRELDVEFLRQAFRILRKSREWNTLSRVRRASGGLSERRCCLPDPCPARKSNHSASRSETDQSRRGSRIRLLW